MARREKISAVDTAWLRMDQPGNLMMICGVLTFDGRVELQRLRKVIEKRFLCFKRFLDIPVSQPGVSFWEADARFDLDHHVVHVALPGRGGRRELQTMVSRLASTPLNPARPLWQFHLVDNYAGGSALVARIHHCYADGIALVQVMLSMTDAAPSGPPALPAPSRRPARARKGDVASVLMQPFAGAMKTALKIGSTLIEKGVEIWQDPAKAVALAEQGGALTSELAKLALMGQDSPTRFKGTPGIAKRAAWADPLPLPEVKAIGKALGASVNDVLLSCVAGALREYLVEKGDPVEGLSLRALVPVNLRPLEKAYKLGNQFGLVFLDLPIGIANPVERLYAVRANMRALKGSYQPVLTLGLLAAVGVGPKLLQDQLLQALSRNASAVMTNVPGPQVPLYLAGAKIGALMFWVPQSGDIGMGVSILSYNGAVQFSLITDRGLVPDPEHVIRRFAPEFEKLMLTALLAPDWEGDLDPEVAARAAGVAGG
ncbi:MAG: wax ester/triacylglycerol synthase family O-acyltransferase [Betaproteobacteria bacterium]|nr:wax ester/triacylglycerol synthase family O-acyltransferase [Betaproteobacteria bacterium]